MEKSKEFFVVENGATPLMRINYDSHLREHILTPVYGVHQSGWPTYMWLWNSVKGPAKSVNESWLRSEDGEQFQKEMEQAMESGSCPMYECLMCGGLTDNEDRVCNECKDNHNF